ncbi:helix-turn-helix domain-containing protein [uncultured Polaribacter sp.]|uniref:winged helix-turn-helix transcriptional regulator n=1 Tax=uncultured Polaribacter sp. TaxID=174711 RepID=UPI0030DC4F8A
MSLTNPHTCAIAYSVSMLGDKWSLLILRDIIIHKKSRFKELKDSKEKIATNILANRLKSLSELGLIEKLDPTGTKKSTRYLATSRGISVLPIIMELYLFSINSIDETTLDSSQINIKREITTNRKLFEKNRIAEYLNFVQELRDTILGVKEQ